MPLILVVEREQRYVERISEALSPEGWSVEGVHDRAGAVEAIADGSAGLLILSSEVEGSRELVDTYSRRSGGPGTVLLIPESADDEAAGFGADEVVQKPFTPEAIRQAVRRCLIDGAKGDRGDRTNGDGAAATAVAARGAPRSGGEATGTATVAAGVQAGDAPAATKEAGSALLTSEDIFGDVVSDLESAISIGTATAAAPEEAPPTELPPTELPRTEVPSTELAARELTGDEPVESEPLPAAEESGRDSTLEEGAVAEPPEPEAAPEVGDSAEAAPPPAATRADPGEEREERLRRAAEEGERRAKDTESADELLRNALLGIGTAPSDVDSLAPARASSEEVDRLLSRVVASQPPVSTAPPASGADSAEADPVEAIASESPVELRVEPAPAEGGGVEEAPGAASAGLEDAPAPGVEVDDSAILDIYGQEEERGSGVRMKLLWAIIIILFLALLAFMFASRADLAGAGPLGSSGARVEHLADGGASGADDGTGAVPPDGPPWSMGGVERSSRSL